VSDILWKCLLVCLYFVLDIVSLGDGNPFSNKELKRLGRLGTKIENRVVGQHRQ